MPNSLRESDLFTVLKMGNVAPVLPTKEKLNGKFVNIRKIVAMDDSINKFEQT